jgi:ubiquinone/menaquinone biosynthesis C-methylase UbiE
VIQVGPDANLRESVRSYWDEESCGERYAVGEAAAYYESHARERYALEPWIRPFARFEEGRGKRVLEVGVGMGADYLEWLRAGAEAVGVDFTPRAVAHTTERCRLEGRRASVAVADGERLPFGDASFDIVYSWGVAHHSPDTKRFFDEVARVLRPSGVARIAIYHYPSWGAFLIWARNALLRGHPLRGVRAVVADNLESPGTKLYTVAEARALCASFSQIRELRTQLGLGDLLTMKPSAKYSDPLSRFVLRVYPRWLIRRLGNGWGGYLLLECVK